MAHSRSSWSFSLSAAPSSRQRKLVPSQVVARSSLDYLVVRLRMPCQLESGRRTAFHTGTVRYVGGQPVWNTIRIVGQVRCSRHLALVLPVPYCITSLTYVTEHGTMVGLPVNKQIALWRKFIGLVDDAWPDLSDGRSPMQKFGVLTAAPSLPGTDAFGPLYHT